MVSFGEKAKIKRGGKFESSGCSYTVTTVRKVGLFSSELFVILYR